MNQTIENSIATSVAGIEAAVAQLTESLDRLVTAALGPHPQVEPSEEKDGGNGSLAGRLARASWRLHVLLAKADRLEVAFDTSPGIGAAIEPAGYRQMR